MVDVRNDEGAMVGKSMTAVAATAIVVLCLLDPAFAQQGGNQGAVSRGVPPQGAFRGGAQGFRGGPVVRAPVVPRWTVDPGFPAPVAPRGFRGPAIVGAPYGYAPYVYAPPYNYYDDSCLQYVPVETEWGWQYQAMRVC